MTLMSEIFNNQLGSYLKQINDQYGKNKEKSISDILRSFSQISPEYNKLEEIHNGNLEKKYSSFNFNECTNDEKEDFFNNQLQFIETLVINSIYEKTGIIWNWYDIFKLMKDPTYKNIEKIKRKVVYSASSNQRPIGDPSYVVWNGLQIIDIDIKDQTLALNLKQILFE